MVVRRAVAVPRSAAAEAMRAPPRYDCFTPRQHSRIYAIYYATRGRRARDG